MQITTKYDVGQKVWINHAVSIKGVLQPVEQIEANIFAIMIWADGEPMYRCGMGNTRTENEVYSTKEEAIADSERYEEKMRSIYAGEI